MKTFLYVIFQSNQRQLSQIMHPLEWKFAQFAKMTLQPGNVFINHLRFPERAILIFEFNNPRGMNKINAGDNCNFAQE